MYDVDQLPIGNLSLASALLAWTWWWGGGGEGLRVEMGKKEAKLVSVCRVLGLSHY